MADNWTVLLVGVTETDGYENLWVTPQGGGDKVKIAAKRSQLHPLFQQGKAVMCNWQTYQNKPYVADAKPIEGELLPPTKLEMLPEHQAEVDKALDEVRVKPSGQETGMWWKQLGDDLRSGHIDKSTPEGKLLRAAYFAQMFKVLEIKFEKKES